MAVSYNTDIRPLFKSIDIHHRAVYCNLGSYDDVKTNAPHILDRLKGVAGAVMPPATSGGPWSAANIALFEKWIDEGCQP
jgi:hypothetical protein